MDFNLSPTALSSPQSRSSDVDFSDVFGGPPRLSSTQEFGYNERNSVDFHGFDDDDNVEDEGSSWHKLAEKPVFGEVAGLVRRRYASNDFFDDIFRGDQPLSCSQSPRVMPRQSPFSLAPGSRVMSPCRSLPPTAEPLATPAKFSLPDRVTNTDFMASTSSNQSSFSPSLSKFNQTSQNHDGGNCSSYRSSALSSQDSVDGKESTSVSQLDGIADRSYFNNYAKASEFPIYTTNFHFSIYKWASKGVPLVISLRKKSPRSKEARSGSEKGVGGDTLFSENHTVDIHVTDALTFEKCARPSSPVKERERGDSIAFSMTEEAKSNVGDTALAESNSISVKEAHYLSRKGSGSVVHKPNDRPKSDPKKKESNMRPLSSNLNDENEGNETVITKKTGDKMKEKEKPSPIADVSCHKVDKTRMHESSPATKNDARGNESTRKVKDFVKVFNQESPSKASGNGLRQSHSRRWKDTKIFEVEHECRLSSARMNDETEASYVNWGETWPDASEMDYGNSFTSGSQQLNMNDIGCVPDTVGKISENAPNADSLTDSAPNTNAASDDVVLGKEATKGYETKVLQWSKGKEGNIRALLSTLQYVLWSDSGWKPIPLVDIIEANAVKRAYQKALLHLHPDKLQQKGAAPHHKLIAEKVFDILQEAWDHFNARGSL